MHARYLLAPVLAATLLSLSCGTNPTFYRSTGEGEGGGGGSGGSSGQSQGKAGTQTGIDLGDSGAAGADPSQPREAVCGNGEREPGELCDDGNTEDDDGCSGDCLEQSTDYICDEPGEDCEKVVVCGNGVLEGEEACDDGNTDSDDGCAGACDAIDDGWECPRPGRDCVQSAECGNGILERGEACDDQNTESGDGCTGSESDDLPSCQLEEGYWCPGAGEDCVELVCGDGNRTSDEACDDGNTDLGDGCSEECTVETGWRCSAGACQAICGDGLLAGDEDCDDANSASGDGCSAACTLEPFWACTGTPSECSSTIECGNGELDPGEICDPPSAATGCLADCTSFSPSTSDEPECGNSVIEAGEECDPPGAGCSEACAVEDGYVCPRPGTCILEPVCGDGRKQAGEECDVGAVSYEGCVDCQVTDGWTCWGLEPSACAFWSCGDGTRQRGEGCDDGNDLDGDGCAANCTVELGWHCSSGGCSAICGDGLVTDMEQCDDGNLTSGDGCSAACFTAPFFDCTGEPSVCETTIVCGDGQVDPGEICDPPSAATGCLAGCKSFAPDVSNPPVCNNSVIEVTETCDPPDVGNGCDANCQVEDGYVCPRPGTCIEEPVCGNGVREASEECDTGDPAATGCPDCVVASGWVCHGVAPSVCEQWACGDGNRTLGEECDDGNGDTGDGCSATCAVETGWRCSSSGCRAVCGDGVIVSGEEQCDDNNSASGDGCSAACTTEPFYTCTAPSSGQSVCSSTIECGNDTIEPGEICDPPGSNGCLAGCTAFDVDSGTPAVCGDNVIQLGEGCDPPQVGSGCAANCTVEAGYACPRPGVCVALPACGNGVREAGEECDDGNGDNSDGCAGCTVTSGWVCHGTPSVCVQPVCGNGVQDFGEECDDDNATGGDGCSAACEVEAGYVCPNVGAACWTICGDGLILGDEDCDNGNNANGDGCNAGCRFEPGWDCTLDTPCTLPDCTHTCDQSVCPNGTTEPGEGCDDDNTIAGDGCGPTCQLEPEVTARDPDTGEPTLDVYCGDGMVTGSEECDDGNDEPGDGCSAACEVEEGFDCTETANYPGSVEFQVTYRDFTRDDLAFGHPDFQVNSNKSVAVTGGTGVLDMVGPVCTSGAAPCDPTAPGATCDPGECGVLDGNGRPVYHFGDSPLGSPPGDRSTAEETLYNDGGSVLNSQTFALWYQNASAAEETILDNSAGLTGYDGSTIRMCHDIQSLVLTQVAAGTDVYEFDSALEYPGSGLFPLGNNDSTPIIPDRCFGRETGLSGSDANYHFTTELRYFFQYHGGETLTFTGDDDVWVFINGRLAVDIGGIHAERVGRVVLGDDGDGGSTADDCSIQTGLDLTPAACTLEAGELDSDDKRFGLNDGGVYEIVLFHAERKTSGSNFKLTLAGFLPPRSVCEPICGDGLVVGYEVCDDGPPESANDGSYGVCNDTCTGLSYCGDDIVQGAPDGPEECDNGLNIDTYDTGGAGICGPGCLKPSARCGNGTLEPPEDCDNGASNSDTAYGSTACTTSCSYGPYCGDGTTDSPEVCDDGASNGAYGAGSCGYDCQPGPYCGDGTRNGPEECDASDDDDPNRDNCDLIDCVLLPYCGDGVRNGSEECDYGQFASNDYGGCTVGCEWGPSCGDGTVNGSEECDDGTAQNTGGYDGCNANCTDGPRCGDGIQQSGEGEACDNGFNEDTYVTGAAGECGAGCQPPTSYCGDGTLDPFFEECDNGASNAADAWGAGSCTDTCEYGGYCGDGIENGTEVCDRGTLNGQQYGPESCGYDCQPGPYCGDGSRNGAEECDGEDHCTADCEWEPFCGDGLHAASAGEECDYGPFSSDEYGGCTDECDLGPHCGDNNVDIPYEECDDGADNDDTLYDGCSTVCTFGPRCGDGEVQASAGEICDNGFNDDTYATGAAGECGSGCLPPAARCGDGIVEPAYEQCDNGSENSDSAYGLDACTTSCTFGAFCGDSIVTSPEACDRGALNGQEYGPDSCSHDCAQGPRCGDGIRNGSEECDGTAHCSSECTLAPHCGDGVRNGSEECDYGQFASNAYGGCTASCEWGPRCGDGDQDEPYEECDLGDGSNDDTYGGCSEACTLGPRCGDGIRQSGEGEACDNGFNDDLYAFGEAPCAAGCTLPPGCGDGEVQSAFELCDEGADNDDDAYNGCTTSCVWGPYCGDGHADEGEACDEGADNTAYSPTGVGCSYDCEVAPFCGDGIRNGPEECDDGEDDNVGGYGKCKPDCTLDSYCGDDHLDPDEECDDGPVGSLSCSRQCTLRAIAY